MARTLRLSTPFLFLAALAGAFACSAAGEDGAADGDDAAGVGGSGAPGSGGAGQSSGGAVGTGGSANGSGGTGTGAEPGSAFTCPSGLENAVPNLTGKTAALVATAPSLGSETGLFLEGPVWADGALYVSQIREWGDQPPARILKLTGATLGEHIADSGTNGLAVRGDGKLVAASHKAVGIVTFDLASPATPPALIADTYETKKFNSPNDLVVRSDGNIYFTDPAYQCGNACAQGKDQGQQRVYRISPAGEVTAIASTHLSPNGIALSPDENTLYVAGTEPLEKFPVSADGTVGARVEFSPIRGVDGLAVDCGGNVYAAVHSLNKIDVIKPDGQLVPGSIAVASSVTNVAFGGADNRTLYVTAFDTNSLYSVELDVPGYPY